MDDRNKDNPGSALLAFDCSTNLVLAASNLEKILTADEFNTAGQHFERPRSSETLLPLLDRVWPDGLRAGARRPAVLACGIGPGSFTGLRLAHITATTQALIWQRPLLGFSSLEFLAWAYSRYLSEQGLFEQAARGLVAIAAPRRSWYVFEFDPANPAGGEAPGGSLLPAVLARHIGEDELARLCTKDTAVITGRPEAFSEAGIDKKLVADCNSYAVVSSQWLPGYIEAVLPRLSGQSAAQTIQELQGFSEKKIWTSVQRCRPEYMQEAV